MSDLQVRIESLSPSQKFIVRERLILEDFIHETQVSFIDNSSIASEAIRQALTGGDTGPLEDLIGAGQPNTKKKAGLLKALDKELAKPANAAALALYTSLAANLTDPGSNADLESQLDELDSTDGITEKQRKLVRERLVIENFVTFVRRTYIESDSIASEEVRSALTGGGAGALTARLSATGTEIPSLKKKNGIRQILNTRLSADPAAQAVYEDLTRMLVLRDSNVDLMGALCLLDGATDSFCPSITSVKVSPDDIYSETEVTITLTGTNLSKDMKFTITDGTNTRINVAGEITFSADSLSLTFKVPANTKEGPYNVNFSSELYPSADRVVPFTVKSSTPPPSISGILPSEIPADAKDISVHVQGVSLPLDATVTIDGTRIGSIEHHINGTVLRFRLIELTDQTPGFRQIRISSPGDPALSLISGVDITAPSVTWQQTWKPTLAFSAGTYSMYDEIAQLGAKDQQALRTDLEARVPNMHSLSLSAGISPVLLGREEMEEAPLVQSKYLHLDTNFDIALSQGRSFAFRGNFGTNTILTWSEAWLQPEAGVSYRYAYTPNDYPTLQNPLEHENRLSLDLGLYIYRGKDEQAKLTYAWEKGKYSFNDELMGRGFEAGAAFTNPFEGWLFSGHSLGFSMKTRALLLEAGSQYGTTAAPQLIGSSNRDAAQGYLGFNARFESISSIHCSVSFSSRSYLPPQEEFDLFSGVKPNFEGDEYNLGLSFDLGKTFGKWWLPKADYAYYYTDRFYPTTSNAGSLEFTLPALNDSLQLTGQYMRLNDRVQSKDYNILSGNLSLDLAKLFF